MPATVTAARNTDAAESALATARRDVAAAIVNLRTASTAGDNAALFAAYRALDAANESLDDAQLEYDVLGDHWA